MSSYDEDYNEDEDHSSYLEEGVGAVDDEEVDPHELQKEFGGLADDDLPVEESFGTDDLEPDEDDEEEF
jgi:hypothetical protein